MHAACATWIWSAEVRVCCSLKPYGEVDPSSLHGSCATTKGEKWSATKWMHVGLLGLSSVAQKAKWADCVDGDNRCGEWATLGECTKNAGYMMSTCRKSCEACKSNKPCSLPFNFACKTPFVLPCSLSFTWLGTFVLSTAALLSEIYWTTCTITRLYQHCDAACAMSQT